MEMNYTDLYILYEDNHLIAAIKPAGILAQADDSDTPDMLTLLKQYIKDKYNKPGDVWLGLVHRLDQPVSGVMVFARTSKAAARLSAQIREHTVGKHYLAVVSGQDIPDHDQLEDILAKDDKTGKVSVVSACGHNIRNAKKAVLRYQKLRSAEYKGRDLALLDIDLGSGRAHQIRVQLASRGWPIIGDARYGKLDSWSRMLPLTRSRDENGKEHADIALFCSSMEIDHPISKTRLKFDAEPTSEFPWNKLK